MSKKTLIFLVSVWPRRAWILQLLSQLRLSDAAKVFVLPVDDEEMIRHLRASELPSYSASELANLVARFCIQKFSSEKRMVKVLDASTSRGHVVGEGEVLEFELKKKTQWAVGVEFVNHTLHIIRTEPGVFKAGLSWENFSGPPYHARGGRYTDFKDYFRIRNKSKS